MTDHVCALVGRFAGEVASIELGEGGVDVVEVEQRRAATIRSSASISTMPSISVPNMPRTLVAADGTARLRTRRSPRVAMTLDVMVSTPTSATARDVRDAPHRGHCRNPAPTTRRRSSVKMSSASSLRYCGPVPGREAREVSLVDRLAAFSSRRDRWAAVPRIARARRRGPPRRTSRSG